jgi:hypothetical protein
LPIRSALGEWATGKGIDAVVWTALKPGFPGSRGATPTLPELKLHIESLPAAARAMAMQYVQKAPA